eukprot:SAG22_NODE_4_length_44774_cov_362.122149_20_plen_432_part_00
MLESKEAELEQRVSQQHATLTELAAEVAALAKAVEYRPETSTLVRNLSERLQTAEDTQRAAAGAFGTEITAALQGVVTAGPEAQREGLQAQLVQQDEEQTTVHREGQLASRLDSLDARLQVQEQALLGLQGVTGAGLVVQELVQLQLADEPRPPPSMPVPKPGTELGALDEAALQELLGEHADALPAPRYQMAEHAATLGLGGDAVAAVGLDEELQRLQAAGLDDQLQLLLEQVQRPVEPPPAAAAAQASLKPDATSFQPWLGSSTARPGPQDPQRRAALLSRAEAAIASAGEKLALSGSRVFDEAQPSTAAVVGMEASPVPLGGGDGKLGGTSKPAYQATMLASSRASEVAMALIEAVDDQDGLHGQKLAWAGAIREARGPDGQVRASACLATSRRTRVDTQCHTHDRGLIADRRVLGCTVRIVAGCIRA